MFNMKRILAIFFDRAELEEFDTSEDSDDPDMEELQHEMDMGFHMGKIGSSIRPVDLAAVCLAHYNGTRKPPKYYFVP